MASLVEALKTPRPSTPMISPTTVERLVISKLSASLQLAAEAIAPNDSVFALGLEDSSPLASWAIR